jgi:two-component system sensor histidine kinase KdpD
MICLLMTKCNDQGKVSTMRDHLRQGLIAYLLALCGVACVVIIYRLIIIDVNTTTVALSFLLVVLATASTYGLGPAITASITGMLCFNFFFLPPVGTLTIEDPQNWVALVAFLVTAVTASQLSSAARRRARDAEARREEVWKLYQLSRAIIATADSETAFSSIARQVVEVFGARYCAVFVPDATGRWQGLANACGPGKQVSFVPSQEIIEEVFRTGEMKLLEAGIEHDERMRSAYAPLKVGVKPVGVMALSHATLERGTIEAIAGLVALALERARFLKEVSRTEALRQSNELKSALLASVSHDLRTPLTSIRAAVDNLLQNDFDWDQAMLREFHSIINEEVHRLTKLVDNLLEMARIEAGELRPSKQWGSVSEIINNVLDRCRASICNHSVKVRLDEGIPLVKVDSRLVAQALTNLVENAAKYSSAESEILLQARVSEDQLLISVTDHGPGIAPDEVDRIFEKFYRSPRSLDKKNTGTGMGLAIARGIIEAMGGRIWVESKPDCGATFTFAIPIEQKPSERSYDEETSHTRG